MPIKTYDTKEMVPEAQRAAAVELKDGKFAVEESDPNAISSAAQTAIDKERERAKAEEKARKAAEKERDDLKLAAEAARSGVSEAELQKIRDAEAAARKPIVDELEETKKENRKLKLTDRVQALALGNGVMPDRIEDAMDQLAKRTDLGDAGGIVFKDKEGKVTADDAAAFFLKFKIEKPWLFQGSGASGSGATGSNGSGGDASPDAKERIAAQKRAQVGGAF